MKKRIVILLAALLITSMVVGCQNNNGDNLSDNNQSQMTTDLLGNEIVLPTKTDKIISLGTSNTDILVALGLTDHLIAIDSYSISIEGIPENLLQFDMMKPDTEQIIALDADIVFVTGMSNVGGGEDIFKPIRDAGVCVVAIPSANSIDEIKKSILFIGEIVNESEEAETIIKSMESEIDKVKEASNSVTTKKKVYFEIASEPTLCTFGQDTFINEMLEIVGAENVFAQQSGWVNVSEESIINANPDVIFTNCDYIENPVGEILQRNGWESIKAIKEEQVYYIDKNASSLSSHNIVIALKQMAKALYPEVYKD
ncbi:MAG: ABC transporter substrate-binding protein [Anaerovorax sp.]|nr:ABC transporter substrate-binding protein [Anaerovorax sp.]